jgi:hypothetical protein
MLGILMGIGVVLGLGRLALSRADDPAPGRDWEAGELARLASLTRLTLDQAEDGLVLSRRYGRRDLERRFAVVVSRLRKTRPRI